MRALIYYKLERSNIYNAHFGDGFFFFKLRGWGKKSDGGGGHELLDIGLACVGDAPVQFSKESNDFLPPKMSMGLWPQNAFCKKIEICIKFCPYGEINDSRG